MTAKDNRLLLVSKNANCFTDSRAFPNGTTHLSNSERAQQTSLSKTKPIFYTSKYCISKKKKKNHLGVAATPEILTLSAPASSCTAR